MKKFTAWLSLCCYIIFSQFVLKAVATTTLEPSGDDSFCVTKKLDTYDGKYKCWKKNNTAVFSIVFDFASYVGDVYASYDVGTHLTTGMFWEYPRLMTYRSQAPPGEGAIIKQHFAHTYVGIILLLF